MEAIAKEAGVGIGTLYRHFPKRIDVVEAVYVDDVDELESVAPHGERRPGAVARVRGLARGLRPLRQRQEALHERAARGVREGPGAALGVAGADRGRPGHRATRAQEAGVVRSDVDAPDLMQLLGSMCMSATLTPDQSERLLVMIEDGLRPQA